jgi:uncharacterized membrane protein YjjB (DUF3815 family)
MLTMTLFALLAMATAASAFATAAVSGAYERRYLRKLATKTTAAVGVGRFRLSTSAAPRHIFRRANKILTLGIINALIPLVPSSILELIALSLFHSVSVRTAIQAHHARQLEPEPRNASTSRAGVC